MIPPTVKAYLATIGKRGGTAGTGRKKRRGDAEHYRRLAALAAQARARKAGR